MSVPTPRAERLPASTNGVVRRQRPAPRRGGDGDRGRRCQPQPGDPPAGRLGAGAIDVAADVHFVSLRQGYEGLVVPSKFHGAVTAGRPVIYEGAAAGEIARIIGESGCGIVVRPGGGAALCAAILALHVGRERRRVSPRALEVHCRRNDPADLAAAYCRALCAALAASSSRLQSQPRADERPAAAGRP
jgi:hypothetical protein